MRVLADYRGFIYEVHLVGLVDVQVVDDGLVLLQLTNGI